MYPRVKVRVETNEENQYAYEKSSLQSLKGFQWLSLDDSSSLDESPQSPVRIPGSYVPKSKDNKKTVLEEKPVNVRASSIPRPRAVLSSPGQKNHNLCQNRHTQCKVIPRYAASFTSSIVGNKEAVERKNDYRAKGTSPSAGPQRRKTMKSK
ncbi:uncharacterized protein LOC111391655 isoform X2 [Olea europaea var. sylvestris]|uniref:uncharacterized protein LOC111391655 isoform X2 n=1 Tax=Olea europaea var. sylvestris TaxID=158386 RepID=UPI000C1D1E45|nr:uncharacterized protein LOC111391655 isoform X2 [Olea europaea var. sylvestris]